MATDPEVAFARVLASNEKPVRTRGVKKVAKWLSKRHKDFEDLELKKLWRGLFYCMWMCDKPLVQEELSQRLSEMVLALPTHENAAAFVAEFYRTMKHEWQGIDRLRLDKYYMLLSDFFQAALTRCKNNNWDAAVTDKMCQVFQRGPLTTEIEVPLGIALHLCDKFHPRLDAAAGDTKVPWPTVQQLLAPFFHVLGKSKTPVLVQRAVQSVFEPLANNLTGVPVQNGAAGAPRDGDAMDVSEDTAEGDEEDEYEEVMETCFEVDWQALCDQLFALAADPTTMERNRKPIYALRRKFIQQCSEAGVEVQEGGVEFQPAVAAAASKKPGSKRPAPEDKATEKAKDGKVANKKQRTAAEGAHDHGDDDASADDKPSTSSKKAKTPAAKANTATPRRTSRRHQDAEDDSVSEEQPGQAERKQDADGNRAKPATPKSSKKKRKSTAAAAAAAADADAAAAEGISEQADADKAVQPQPVSKQPKSAHKRQKQAATPSKATAKNSGASESATPTKGQNGQTQKSPPGSDPRKTPRMQTRASRLKTPAKQTQGSKQASPKTPLAAPTPTTGRKSGRRVSWSAHDHLSFHKKQPPSEVGKEKRRRSQQGLDNSFTAAR